MNGSKAGGQPQPQSQPQSVGIPILTPPTTLATPLIIQPKWAEGDRVDYVPRGMSSAPSVLATSLGQGLVGGTYGAAAQKAQEEQAGRRHRAVIDKRISDEQYRIIITDSMDTVWAHSDEIEALSVIDRLGDMVGPESRSLKEGLRSLEEKETREER